MSDRERLWRESERVYSEVDLDAHDAREVDLVDEILAEAGTIDGAAARDGFHLVTTMTGIRRVPLPIVRRDDGEPLGPPREVVNRGADRGIVVGSGEPMRPSGGEVSADDERRMPTSYFAALQANRTESGASRGAGGGGGSGGKAKQVKIVPTGVPPPADDHRLGPGLCRVRVFGLTPGEHAFYAGRPDDRSHEHAPIAVVARLVARIIAGDEPSDDDEKRRLRYNFDVHVWDPEYAVLQRRPGAVRRALAAHARACKPIVVAEIDRTIAERQAAIVQKAAATRALRHRVVKMQRTVAVPAWLAALDEGELRRQLDAIRSAHAS